MPKVIFSLLFASFVILVAGCKKENASTSITEVLLSNSKWKVVETTYVTNDTAITYSADQLGGFYLELNSNKEYTYTSFPYISQRSGKWEYSASDKKLILEFDESRSFMASYDVIKVTGNRLVLSQAGAGLTFVPGPDDAAVYVLHPY